MRWDFCGDALVLFGVVRRFFVRREGVLESLFTSLELTEVEDLLPMPLRRALNLRFVAFMAVIVSCSMHAELLDVWIVRLVTEVELKVPKKGSLSRL